MRVDNTYYKVGDVAVAAAFICCGAVVQRIDRTTDKGNRARVLFVFDKAEVEPLELSFLAYNCSIDARKYADTINNLRRIIQDTINNIG